MGVIETLRNAVEELDIACDLDDLRAVVEVRDRLEAKIAHAVARIDAAALWELAGATSMVAWLRDACRMSGRDAARLAQSAKRMARLAVCGDAWRTGVLSSGQVDEIVRGVPARAVELFAEHEAGLVPMLGALGVDDTKRVMRKWRACAEAVVDGSLPDEPCHVRVSPVGDRYRLDGDLDAEGGAIVAAALQVAERADDDNEVRSPGQRRGDALVDICRDFLDHQHRAPETARHRPHLNVIVDDTSAHVVNGPELDAATTERLLCDATIHRVVMSGKSEVLDYGRGSRTVPNGLWNALVVRDEHCRWPGCDRPSRWAEAHHVRHWEHGGDTALANLALLCVRHHHVLHKPGWHAKLLPDATLEVTSPTGLTRSTRPPGALSYAA